MRVGKILREYIFQYFMRTHLKQKNKPTLSWKTCCKSEYSYNKMQPKISTSKHKDISPNNESQLFTLLSYGLEMLIVKETQLRNLC